MQKISIIIPTWNEEKNVTLLVKRINAALTAHNIIYEIIFIDDHSTDKTASRILALEKKYPIRLYSKLGEQGKAYSLLEGFHYAYYDLFCMIDADLQYQPRDIPRLIEKVNHGAEIVVANRQNYSAGKLRKLMSTVFHSIFAQWLHGFEVDVQSGLKVFTRTVEEHIPVNPTPWTFDMEFLLKARKAGYKIDSINIAFKKRHSGNSKIAVIQSSFEIALNAIKLKLADLDSTSFYHRGKALLNSYKSNM